MSKTSCSEWIGLSSPSPSLSLYRDGDEDASDIRSEREVFELAHEVLGKGGKGGAQ